MKAIFIFLIGIIGIIIFISIIHILFAFIDNARKNAFQKGIHEGIKICMDFYKGKDLRNLPDELYKINEIEMELKGKRNNEYWR